MSQWSPSWNPPSATIRSAPVFAPLVVSRITGNGIILLIRSVPPLLRYDPMCIFASGPSTFCSTLPPGISVPRVPIGVFSIGIGLSRLRRGLGFDLGRALERELEHLFHTARQVERHRVAHALRHIVEILLV